MGPRPRRASRVDRPASLSSLGGAVIPKRKETQMRALTAAAILAIAALLGLMPAKAATAPELATESPVSVWVPPTTTTTLSTPEKPSRAVLEASSAHSCPGWASLAYQAGWPQEEIPMLLAVMYQESRCLIDARGDHGQSWTSLQIHTPSWCRPTRYYPNGYLQTIGIITTCDDLWQPETTLKAALAIWQYGGWKQWTTWRTASTTLGH